MTTTSAPLQRAEKEGAVTRRLSPFGLEVRFPEGTRWDSIDPDLVHNWVKAHRVVVFRGVKGFTKEQMPLEARRLGPLQVWPFGAINELIPDKNAKNYLYTDRAVPLHWDGAFARTPRYLFFHCVSAVEVEGGETVFVDTTKIWENADVATRDRWRSLKFNYETERVVHYGGSFAARLVSQHPTTNETVLRWAEPVDDLNPVYVSAEGISPLESGALITELRSLMYDTPDATYLHTWESGDIVVADNHALLHGRRAFIGGEQRHIRRVNIHDPEERTWRSWVRDSIRIRRPEFMVAEIPILLIPTLLIAGGGTILSWRFLELAVLFFSLFHFGDMINCYCDRDLDAVYKTHQTEAVYGLGLAGVRRQMAVTIAVALALATHLAFVTGHLDIIALVLFGLVLGGAYSIPPVRLKGRGILQVATLWAVIFVGPMLLVVRTLSPVADPLKALSLDMLLLVGAYGAMQQGTILVNTAEDLPEDKTAKIHTTAVALGLSGCIGLATTMVALGGACVALCLFRIANASVPTILPLALAWVWVVYEIGSAWIDVSGKQEDAALKKLRPRARRMPFWITATAWSSLIAAVAIAAAR